MSTPTTSERDDGRRPGEAVDERAPVTFACRDTGLPVHLSLDGNQSTDDVLDALAVAAFATGDEPHARWKNLERVRTDAALVPDGGRIIRHHKADNGFEVWLAKGEGWTIHATRWQSRSGAVRVSAVSGDLADEVVVLATKDVCEPVVETEDTVAMGFWHLGSRGPTRNKRTVDAPVWSTIRAGYTGTVAPALDRLMALTATDVRGRLVLLHGPPGTGKTTALRALARSWSPWCEIEYILDAEVLFANPGYLMEVAMGDDGEREGRWRLLVLEDCDELIAGSARARSGQALSRLLNLTDGLLGQGLDVLVCLTTNEPLHRIHPAVARAGRCLAEIEVGRLTRAEAAVLLGSSAAAGDLPPEGCTLAEVHARLGDVEKVEAKGDEVVPGQYL